VIDLAQTFRAFAFLAGIPLGIVVAAPCVRAQPAPPSLATGKTGMVSTGHALATEAGLSILSSGGNAFDAAVAIAAALNVVEPMMSGIGGYGTILIYDAKTKRTRFLNSSGRIPAATNSDAYRSPTPNYMENRRGAKAISTPRIGGRLSTADDAHVNCQSAANSLRPASSSRAEKSADVIDGSTSAASSSARTAAATQRAYFFSCAGVFTNIDLMLSHSSILAPWRFMMNDCCSTDSVLFHAQ